MYLSIRPRLFRASELHLFGAADSNYIQKKISKTENTFSVTENTLTVLGQIKRLKKKRKQILLCILLNYEYNDWPIVIRIALFIFVLLVKLRIEVCVGGFPIPIRALFENNFILCK